MLMLKDGTRLTIWKDKAGNHVKKFGKLTRFSAKSSEKQQDDTYEQSHWNMVLWGQKANDMADELIDKIDADGRATIEVHGGKITNPYNAEYGKCFTNLYVWNFEIMDFKTRNSTPSFEEESEPTELEMPF